MSTGIVALVLCAAAACALAVVPGAVKDLGVAVIGEVGLATVWFGRIPYFGIEAPPRAENSVESALQLLREKWRVKDDPGAIQLARLDVGRVAWRFRQAQLYGPREGAAAGGGDDARLRDCQARMFGAKYLMWTLLKKPVAGIAPDHLEVRSIADIDAEAAYLLQRKGGLAFSRTLGGVRAVELRTGLLLAWLYQSRQRNFAGAPGLETEGAARKALAEATGSDVGTEDEAKWTLVQCRRLLHTSDDEEMSSATPCVAKTDAEGDSFFVQVGLALGRLGAYAPDGFSDLRMGSSDAALEPLTGQVGDVWRSTFQLPTSLSTKVLREKSSGVTSVLGVLYDGPNELDAVSTYERWNVAIRHLCVGNAQTARWYASGQAALWLRYSASMTIILANTLSEDKARAVTLVLAQQATTR